MSAARASRASVLLFAKSAGEGWGGKTFPDGVIGEKIHVWDTSDVMGNMTPEVKEFIEKKELLEQYTRIVSKVASTPQSHYGNFAPDQVCDAIMSCAREFEKQNACAFTCVRTDEENVQHIWVEYVDLDVASDYTPAEQYKRSCTIC
jgi:hypothetical protein